MQSFCEKFPIAYFSKGEIILQQDQTPKCVYVLKKGLIESYNYTETGYCRSISFNVPGDIIVEECAFSVSKTSLFYVKAYTNCELYKINKNDFNEAVFGKNEFRNEIMRMGVLMYVGAKLQLDALGKSNGYKKILYMLRFFCLEYGKDLGKNIVLIQIPLTHQEIANFCGLTRETTTVFVNKLKKRMIINNISGKYYEIRTDILNNEMDDEYNSGFSVHRL